MQVAVVLLLKAYHNHKAVLVVAEMVVYIHQQEQMELQEQPIKVVAVVAELINLELEHQEQVDQESLLLKNQLLKQHQAVGI
jgi:hypothetical protein